MSIRYKILGIPSNESEFLDKAKKTGTKKIIIRSKIKSRFYDGDDGVNPVQKELFKYHTVKISLVSDNSEFSVVTEEYEIHWIDDYEIFHEKRDRNILQNLLELESRVKKEGFEVVNETELGKLLSGKKFEVYTPSDYY